MKDKPRVLYIAIDPYLGGSTASLYNLIDGIRDQIELIVLFPEMGEGYEYFKQQGIECYVYPFVRLHEFRKNSFGEVLKRPWKWHYIAKFRFDYGGIWFVSKILKGRHINIVHTNTSPNDIGVLLSRKLHAKHVWHVREFCDLHFNYEIYGGLDRLRSLINLADARIAISTAIKEHWQMPDKNTYVINDAVRSCKDICYEPRKKRYLLFSSYFLTEAKGTRRAILAFAQSGMAEQGYSLRLMGNCEEQYKQSLIGTAKECNLLPCIEFVPCQADIKPWFSHATAYIMASENEGLGRVTAEAMFYGCPVIAHATGGTLDLVKDGETGYLFNTIEECAQLIRKVCLENQEPMIMRAQEFAVNNLSEEVYGPKIIEVYNQVLSK